MKIWNWFKKLLDSNQMFIIEKSFLNITFKEVINKSWSLCDSYSKKSKEFLLILRSCWFEFNFITNSVKKSQCKQFIEWWFSIRLNFINYFLENYSVNLIVCSVNCFFSIQNIHDTFFIHLINIWKYFFMN